MKFRKVTAIIRPERLEAVEECLKKLVAPGISVTKVKGFVMDHVVALVQAYLQINAYFTVVESPIIEATRYLSTLKNNLYLLNVRVPT